MQKIFFSKAHLLFLCLFFGNSVGCLAQTETILNEANQSFSEKKYDAAIVKYQQLLTKNGQSPEIEYNLANSFYQQDELGRAILHYYRAAKLAPFDVDINHNLALVESVQADKLSTIKPFFLIRWLKTARNLLSSDTWAITGLLFVAMFGVCMLGWLFGEQRNQKRKSFFFGLAFLAASTLPFWAATELFQLENHSGFGIILPAEVAIRSAPDPESEIVVSIHEGLKIELLDTIGDWLKIELPNGEQGWIPIGAAEEV